MLFCIVSRKVKNMTERSFSNSVDILLALMEQAHWNKVHGIKQEKPPKEPRTPKVYPVSSWSPHAIYVSAEVRDMLTILLRSGEDYDSLLRNLIFQRFGGDNHVQK